jgi:hypothetical protein
MRPRDQTIKAQLPYPLVDRARITATAQAFLVDQLERAYGQPAPRLAPCATTSYRRTTLVDLEHGARLTCDVDLSCSAGGRSAVGPSRFVLVETKCMFPHSDAEATLRQLGLRPVSMSKYCIAVALLSRASGPIPWHRTLRRYFAGTFGVQATY